jgi:hypothetical protein
MTNHNVACNAFVCRADAPGVRAPRLGCGRERVCRWRWSAVGHARWPTGGRGPEVIADAGGVAYGKTDTSGRYSMSFSSDRTGHRRRNLVRIMGDKVSVGGKTKSTVFPQVQ